MDVRIEVALAKLANEQRAARSVEDLASSLNLSASRLRHLFKREMGAPLGAFIRTSRMERARILLGGSFLSVKQVMYEVGLTDETYFIRDFKRAWGVTPGAYRQRFHPVIGAGGGSQISRQIAILADDFLLTSQLPLKDIRAVA